MLAFSVSFLPRSSLLTIYKSFIRPHLDHGDVIYDQPSNANFSIKIESTQFNAALAIRGVITCSAPEKLYQELGLEYLHDRRWMRRLCLFYKVLLNKVPKYIYRFILPFRHAFRNPNLFTSFTCRTEYFKNSFFPSAINDWNILDPKIRNCTTYLSFKKCPNKFYQTFREKKSEKPQNGKPKFLNLLILEYLNLFFIEPNK